jgi:MYXO-CTERM domain-containing protein
VAAVMYPIIDANKRVLTADDARGVCAIYPPALDPHSCTQNTPDDGCGCATAGRGLGSEVATLLPALGLLLARRRRPRRR